MQSVDAPIFIQFTEPLTWRRALMWLWQRLPQFRFRWLFYLAVAIALPIVWAVAHDRFYYPEILIAFWALGLLAIAWEIKLRRRAWSLVLKAVCLLSAAGCAALILWPGNSSRFSDAHLESVLVQYQSPLVRSAMSQPDGFWMPIDDQLVLPSFVYRFLGGESFFDGAMRRVIPAELVTLRNVQRWNLTDPRKSYHIGRLSPGKQPPEPAAIQAFHSAGKPVQGANISGWSRDSIRTLIDGNPAAVNDPQLVTHLEMIGRIEKNTVDALLSSSANFALTFGDIKGVEVGVPGLRSAWLSGQLKSVSIWGLCAMNDELMEMLEGIPFNGGALVVSGDLDDQRLADFCSQLRVPLTQWQWKTPMSVASAQAISQSINTLTLSGNIPEDAIAALVTSRVQYLGVSEEVVLTEHAVEDLLAMPSLRSLRIGSSDLSVDAIRKLIDSDKFSNLHIISSAISNEDALVLTGDDPRFRFILSRQE